MKVLFSLFFILFLNANHDFRQLPKGQVEKDLEYIDGIMEPYSVPHRRRIRNCIQYYSYVYDIPVTIMTRLAETESGFRHWKVNEYSQCVGLFQVSPEWWSHLAWKACGGRYAKYLNKHRGTNIINVLKYIELNTHISAIIIDDYRDRYGDYKSLLRVYGGFRAEKYRHKTNMMNEYIGKVLVDYE